MKDTVTVWCKTDFCEKLMAHPVVIHARKAYKKALHKERQQYLRRKGARK